MNKIQKIVPNRKPGKRVNKLAKNTAIKIAPLKHPESVYEWSVCFVSEGFSIVRTQYDDLYLNFGNDGKVAMRKDFARSSLYAGTLAVYTFFFTAISAFLNPLLLLVGALTLIALIIVRSLKLDAAGIYENSKPLSIDFNIDLEAHFDHHVNVDNFLEILESHADTAGIVDLMKRKHSSLSDGVGSDEYFAWLNILMEIVETRPSFDVKLIPLTSEHAQKVLDAVIVACAVEKNNEHNQTQIESEVELFHKDFVKNQFVEDAERTMNEALETIGVSNDLEVSR